MAEHVYLLERNGLLNSSPIKTMKIAANVATRPALAWLLACPGSLLIYRKNRPALMCKATNSPGLLAN